jgi:type II secretory pathway component PulK
MMRLRNNKGSLLITATIILVILSVGAIGFGLWLAVQSKGTTHKKIIAKEQYYGEAGVQKALRFIQERPLVQQQMTDAYPTHYFVLNMVMEDGTKVEVSAWDVP